MTIGAQRVVHACDGVGGSRTGSRWCGVVVGRRPRGRLSDPRLDLGCASRGGKGAAFAWIEPHGATRFVVVRHDGFSEAYETAAGLPVRVATERSIDLAGSSATLDVSEHSEDGRLLARYELRATVAG